MNWINIHTDTLRSEDYLGAEPVERATWLNLIGWCCSQENGGVIKNAANWSDRKWQQLCGVTKEEATLVSDLYQLETNGDLIVSLYPISKEQEVIAKREVAKVNGKKGGRPKKETKGEPTSVISDNQHPNLERKRKGREGKDKEKGMEEKGTIRFAPPSPSDVQEYGKTLTPPFDEAEQFVSFYESKGWLVGRSKMKDWKSAVRGWHARKKKETTNDQPAPNSIAAFAAQNR